MKKILIASVRAGPAVGHCADIDQRVIDDVCPVEAAFA